MLVVWPCRQPVNRGNKKSCPTGFIPLQEAVLNSCQKCVWYGACVWVLFEIKQCKHMACMGKLPGCVRVLVAVSEEACPGLKQQQHVLAPVRAQGLSVP